MTTHSSILAWRIPWTAVHGVAKSRTQLSDFHFISLGQSHFTNYNNIKFYKQDGIRIEMQ